MLFDEVRTLWTENKEINGMHRGVVRVLEELEKLTRNEREREREMERNVKGRLMGGQKRQGHGEEKEEANRDMET